EEHRAHRPFPGRGTSGPAAGELGNGVKAMAAATGWQVIGASVQGRSHRRANLPCQDAHRWAPAGKGGVVAAVADGAGSAACAATGAGRPPEAALEKVFSHPGRAAPADDREWISLLEAVFRAGRSILTVQASEYDLPLEDFATTLLVAIVTAERVAVGQ